MNFTYKNLLLAFFLFFIFQDAFTQLVMSANETTDQGINIEELDSAYTPAIGADSIVTVFQGQEEAYVKAYYSLIHDLSTYLNQHNFRWGEQVRCFNRIYFAAEGTVDYYIYDFKAYLSDEQKAEFQELINEFMADYQFGLSADQPFAQCSPVNFRDTL